MDKLIGFIWQHGDDDYSTWKVELSDEDMAAVMDVLVRYETEGYSVRGDGALTVSE